MKKDRAREGGRAAEVRRAPLTVGGGGGSIPPMAEERKGADSGFYVGMRSEFEKELQKKTALALVGSLAGMVAVAWAVLRNHLAEPLWVGFLAGSALTAGVFVLALFLLGVYWRRLARLAEIRQIERENAAKQRGGAYEEIRGALSLIDLGTLERFDTVYRKYAAMVGAAHDLLRQDVCNSVSMEEQEWAPDARGYMVQLITDHVLKPSNDALGDWSQRVELARELPIGRRGFADLLATGELSVARAVDVLCWIYRAGQALSKWDDLRARPNYQAFFDRYSELLDTLRSSDLAVASAWRAQLSVLQGFPPRPPLPP